MARSMYVYVVLDGSRVVAAFTVKRELNAWLRKAENYSELRFFRCRDNPGIFDVPVELSASFLADTTVYTRSTE